MKNQPRWTTEPHDAKEALARAQSQTRFGKYVLGAGGFHPETSNPSSPHWQTGKVGCDCSGFVLWCWGVSRVQRAPDGTDHINTDWLVADARGAQKRVMLVDLPSPGDAVVFGAHVGKDGQRKIGHTGIIVAASGGMGSIFERMRVIHCSAGNFRRFGYAIAETDGQAFNGGKDTIFVRPLR